MLLLLLLLRSNAAGDVNCYRCHQRIGRHSPMAYASPKPEITLTRTSGSENGHNFTSRLVWCQCALFGMRLKSPAGVTQGEGKSTHLLFFSPLFSPGKKRARRGQTTSLDRIACLPCRALHCYKTSQERTTPKQESRSKCVLASSTHCCENKTPAKQQTASVFLLVAKHTRNKIGAKQR